MDEYSDENYHARNHHSDLILCITTCALPCIRTTMSEMIQTSVTSVMLQDDVYLGCCMLKQKMMILQAEDFPFECKFMKCYTNYYVTEYLMK